MLRLSARHPWACLPVCRPFASHVFDPYGPPPEVLAATEQNNKKTLPVADLSLFRVPDLRYLLRFAALPALGSREALEARLAEHGQAEMPLEGREKVATNFNSEIQSALAKVPASEHAALLLSALRQLVAEDQLQPLLQQVALDRALAASSVADSSALACVAARVREEAMKSVAEREAARKSAAAKANPGTIEEQLKPAAGRGRFGLVVEGIQLMESQEAGTKQFQPTPLEAAAQPISEVLLQRRRAILNLDLQKLGVGGIPCETRQRLQRGLLSWALDDTSRQKLGLKHQKGMLLFGPPGCGKTLIARTLSQVLCSATVQHVTAADINSKWFGESEQKMQALFEPARESKERGRTADIHLIVMDEIDGLAAARSGSMHRNHESALNVLLACLDGLEENEQTLVIGLTNRKDKVDPALLRPGRLGLHLELGLPDAAGRRGILEIHLAALLQNGLLGQDVCLQELAEQTEDFSGAELRRLADTAVSQAVLQAGEQAMQAGGALEGLVDRRSMEFALAEAISAKTTISDAA